MLKDFFEKIFRKYQSAKKEKFIDHPIVKLIQEDIPKYLEEITPNSNNYVFKGNAGKGNFTQCPSVAILNKKITKGVGSGYFVIYLFSKDTKRLYLSLNQVILGSPEADLKDRLLSKADEYRDRLGEIPDDFNMKKLSLGNPNFYSRYEVANICAKEYTLENLSNDEELENDLKEILTLYSTLESKDRILKIIEDSNEIRNAENKLLEILKENANDIITTDKVDKFIGQVKAYRFDNLGISFINREYEPYNRYFNGFGIERPDSNGNFNIFCEINIKKKGLDKTVAGAFAKDSEGRIYLIHRGNFGYMSKNKFIDNYSGEIVEIQDGDIENKVVMIGELDDPKLPEKIRDFVHGVAKIKKINIENDEIDIKNFLENIFRNYNSAKRKKDIVSGHKLSQAFNDFTNELKEHVNKLGNEAEYDTYTHYQSRGTWDYNPYIKITDRGNKKYLVSYSFTENINGVHLSLELDWNYVKSFLINVKGREPTDDERIGYVKSETLKYCNQIKEFTKLSGNFVHSVEKAGINSIYTIITKYYDKNSLPSNNQMIVDLKEILNLFSKLSGGNNTSFFDFLAEKGYLFDSKLVENFLLSLKVKPFVILTGNSGTGKTKVAQLFAQYLNQDKEDKKTKKEPISIISNKVISKHIPINSYLLKNRGGWVLNIHEKNNLKQVSNNFTLALFDKPRNKFHIGQGYVKDNKLFCIEDNDFYTYLKNYRYGYKTIYFIMEQYHPNLDLNNYLVKDEDKIKNYEIVPVGANWTENRHIIGFFNVITEKYQGTEALDLILLAMNNTEKPYFLILDEMNLSHVERYFSDFLSAMESDEEIELHKADFEVVKNDSIPPRKIKLSENLIVVGTVNIDETTYMFSPKVLDRANTLEFLTQSAKNYMSNTPNYSFKGDLNYLENPLSDIDIENKINLRTENISQLKNRLYGIKTRNNEDLWEVLSKNIENFQNILKDADFDFGFRTINEIIRFMCVAWKYEKQPAKWNNWERYFDAQIIQKMLPKLNGSQKELSKALEDLENECNKGNFNTSKSKIKRMRKTLQAKRYVSFTG